MDSDEEEGEAKLSKLPSSEALYTVKIGTSSEELKTSGSGDGVRGGVQEGPKDMEGGGGGGGGGAVGGVSAGGRGQNKERRGSKRKRKKSQREGTYVKNI